MNMTAYNTVNKINSKIYDAIGDDDDALRYLYLEYRDNSVTEAIILGDYCIWESGNDDCFETEDSCYEYVKNEFNKIKELINKVKL